jgi:anaphase-promoting complex subunit 6
MFTPPGHHADSSSLSFSPLPANINPRRRQAARSSLSASFSFAPIVDASHDLSATSDGEPSFSFSAPSAPGQRQAGAGGAGAGTSSRRAGAHPHFSPAAFRHVVDQGNRGMAQVSPRAKPRGSPASQRSGASGRTVTVMPKEVPRTRSRLAEESSPEPIRRSPRKRTQTDEEVDEDEDVDEERTWSMVDSMRLWRHDAIMQHLYETAAFWGDKILSWTGEQLDWIFRLGSRDGTEG